MEELKDLLFEVPFDINELVFQGWEVRSSVNARPDPKLALEAAFALCADYEALCFNIYNTTTIFSFHSVRCFEFSSLAIDFIRSQLASFFSLLDSQIELIDLCGQDKSKLESFEARVSQGLKAKGIVLQKDKVDYQQMNPETSTQYTLLCFPMTYRTDSSHSLLNRALQYYSMVGLSRAGWKRIETNNFIKRVHGSEYDSVRFEINYANPNVTIRLAISSITLHILEVPQN